MSIPDYQTFMRPVLAFLADGEVRRTRDVVDAMADLYRLTDEERTERISSGSTTVVASRVGWALTYLGQSGLVESPSRGHKKITEAGTEALVRYPSAIDLKALEHYPSFLEFRERKGTRSQQSVGQPGPDPIPEEETKTPNELVEEARRANRAVVESEVLAAALSLTPVGFEELVNRLLEKMGYGSAGAIERTAASGDGGIDGIISQDPLGLDRIYVQAKRYTDTPVDRPLIHGFIGALFSKQGDRGVFITTSRFTSGAREEAEKINARIELIDGERLAKLLVQHEIGVQSAVSVTLYRLDEDYFESI